MKTTKAILLTIWYGSRIDLTTLLSVSTKILGVMMLISALSPDNPIRLICVCTGIFSIYFGSVKSLNK